MALEERVRWQPVVVIVRGRLECRCGALAVFVTGAVRQEQYNALEEVDCWCQACFEQAQDMGYFDGGTESD